MAIRLPMGKTVVDKNLSLPSVLIYGDPKFGKSTWCFDVCGDEGLFLATEPGLNYIPSYKIDIGSWEDIRAAVLLLKNESHNYKNVIIDTIDNAYIYCVYHVCLKYKVSHPSDIGFGKGWSLIYQEFTRMLLSFNKMNISLFLVSHSIDKKISLKSGLAYNKSVPTVPEKVIDFILGLVDIIMYCDYTDCKSGKKERVLRSRPTNEYYAGDRTNVLPETIDFDGKNFFKYFKMGNRE